MDKRTAIQALCEIVSGVGHIHFNNQYEHDCFCESGSQITGEPIIHKEVIEFIREAVADKMAQHNETVENAKEIAWGVKFNG